MVTAGRGQASTSQPCEGADYGTVPHKHAEKSCQVKLPQNRSLERVCREGL